MPSRDPRGEAMRRRDFITVLGGTAATWPAVAQAQQAERVRRVGVLIAVGTDDDDSAPEPQARIASFVKGLNAFGWIEGRNFRLDIHLPKTSTDEIRKHVA